MYAEKRKLYRVNPFKKNFYPVEKENSAKEDGYGVWHNSRSGRKRYMGGFRFREEKRESQVGNAGGKKAL